MVRLFERSSRFISVKGGINLAVRVTETMQSQSLDL